jgi:hypothetical protein
VNVDPLLKSLPLALRIGDGIGKSTADRHHSVQVGIGVTGGITCAKQFWAK